MSSHSPFTMSRGLLLAISLVAPVGCNSVDLWPLYERDDETTTVAYPFYVREGPFVMAFPFYYRTNEGRDHHVLWPLVKTSEGRLVRAAPFYYSSDSDEFTLFPLIHQSPERTILGVPPAYLGEDVVVMLPFYVRANDWRFALPNLFWHYDNGELDQLVALGIFGYLREEDSETLWVTPYCQVRGEHETLTAFYPLFESKQVREGDMRTSSLNLFWPLYARRVTETASGELIHRSRRFMIFGDQLDRSGARTLSILGLTISERTRS